MAVDEGRERMLMTVVVVVLHAGRRCNVTGLRRILCDRDQKHSSLLGGS